MKKAAFALALLVLPTATVRAQDKETHTIALELSPFRQLTLSGLYGENRLVKAGGNPLWSLTYSSFERSEIRIGHDDDEPHHHPLRLHLPNGGWYVDALTGSRAGTQVQSFGVGGVVRFSSTPLDGTPARRDRLYYGMGVGLYATRVEAARHTTRVGAGLRLFGGWDRPDGSVIEWGYTYRPGTQGVHPSGLSLGIGRRF